MTDNPTTVLVCAHRAARALGLRRHTLSEWAGVGFVVPAAVDDQGHRRWEPDDLRRQLLARVDDHRS
jgi:DNA-binding transcriptional MerR regulator